MNDVDSSMSFRVTSWWFKLVAWILWRKSENLRHQFDLSETLAWQMNMAHMEFNEWLAYRIWQPRRDAGQ